MKKHLFIIYMIFIITPGISISSTDNSILKYLPESNRLQNWKASDSPEIFHGKDLFLLINGGAEIYYEYGFKSVVAQDYSNQNDKIINLEIYEMIDDASAYGIYTFKTGNSGKSIDIGKEALLEDYYLNFWKGNFVVTLVGFDTDEATLKGIQDIAIAIDNKIIEKGAVPDLTKFLPRTNLDKLNIKYLRGNLALYNNYVFDSQNIFGLKEGILCDYKNHTLFIFSYKNENESSEWFKNAGNHIKLLSRFKNFQQQQNKYHFTDKDNNKIITELYQKYIIILISKNDIEAEELIKNIKFRINNNKIK